MARAVAFVFIAIACLAITARAGIFLLVLVVSCCLMCWLFGQCTKHFEGALRGSLVRGSRSPCLGDILWVEVLKRSLLIHTEGIFVVSLKSEQSSQTLFVIPQIGMHASLLFIQP